LAPNLLSTVQVTKLAPLGALAKEKKDLIVEFDDSERRTALEEALLEVEQIDEQIKKAQAESGHTHQSGSGRAAEGALLGAPGRTRSEAQRADIAHRRQEERTQPRRGAPRATARERYQIAADPVEADLAVLREKRARSMLDVGAKRTRIAQSKLLSPLRAWLRFSRIAAASRVASVSKVPDIREGDTLQPGTPVAEVLDLSEMEIIAKVGELDRANLQRRPGSEIPIGTLFPQDLSRQDQGYERHGDCRSVQWRPREEVRRDFLRRHERVDDCPGSDPGTNPQS